MSYKGYASQLRVSTLINQDEDKISILSKADDLSVAFSQSLS